MADLDRLIDRAEELLARLEQLLPAGAPDTDWCATAYRWRRRGGHGHLQPVLQPHPIRLEDLRDIEPQKQALERNIRQFVAGLPANNVLLWGSRGTGKSSLIKALLHAYAERGLRLVEVDKPHLEDLPEIAEQLRGRPERFLIFSDDLSFEADDASYKALKSLLDGSVAAPPENLLICATSNRRHLLPEYMHENLEARVVETEIHHGEAVEEKISLSERFGLWLSFYPFNQDQYLDIVFHWLDVYQVDCAESEPIRRAALQWALARGSRSGRSARQFAQDWAGRNRLEQGD